MAEGLTLDRADGIATITMRAPERRNALTLEMAAAMIEACEAIDADAEIGAVIVKGEGGYFCAGGDRATLAEAGQDPAAPEVYEGMSTIYGAFARVGGVRRHGATREPQTQAELPHDLRRHQAHEVRIPREPRVDAVEHTR